MSTMKKNLVNKIIKFYNAAEQAQNLLEKKKVLEKLLNRMCNQHSIPFFSNQIRRVMSIICQYDISISIKWSLIYFN